MGAISCNTLAADSATAFWFFGENRTQGSIFWLIHAFNRPFRVELLAFALLSETVRT